MEDDPNFEAADLWDELNLQIAEVAPAAAIRFDNFPFGLFLNTTYNALMAKALDNFQNLRLYSPDLLVGGFNHEEGFRIYYTPFGVSNLPNGRIAHYCGQREAPKCQIGILRMHAFFACLYRSLVFQQPDAIGRGYSVHTVFLNMAHKPPGYDPLGVARRFNFGTTVYNGSEILNYPNHDPGVWPVNYWSHQVLAPVGEEEELFILQHTTPTRFLGEGANNHDFVMRLFQDTQEALPNLDDSGGRSETLTTVRLFQIFLVTTLQDGAPAVRVFPIPHGDWNIGEVGELDFLEGGAQQVGDLDFLGPPPEEEELLDLPPIPMYHEPPRGRGLGEVFPPPNLDLSHLGGRSIPTSSRNLFSASFAEDGHCYWMCLLYAIAVRHEGGWVLPSAWYTEHAAVCARSVKMGGVKRERVLKRHFPSFLAAARRQEGVESECFTKGVLLSHASYYASHLFDFDVEQTCVIAETGEVLDGCSMPHKCQIRDNGLLLTLVENHYMVVESYTNFLMVKICHLCKARFRSAKGLKSHLVGENCRTCACRSLLRNKQFESAEAYQFHMDNLATECPLEVERIRLALNGMGEAKRVALRFPHDSKKKLLYGSAAMREEQVMEASTAPEYTHQEAIYFDLESIVPDNTVLGKCKREELQSQAPYAAGWIRRTELLAGGEVQLEYGTGCIATFMHYLDDYFQQLKQAEVKRRAANIRSMVELQPIPKKSGGYENYARRVRKWWLSFLASGAKECEQCGIVFEEEGLEEEDCVRHGFHVEGDGGEASPHVFSTCAVLYYAAACFDQLVKVKRDGCPSIPIYAHNGGRYDWLFLHRFMMSEGRTNELVTVRSGGKYISLTYRGIFHFRDSLSFLSGSLEQLGKNFAVATLKGMFPYRLVHNAAQIHAVYSGEEEVRSAVRREYFMESFNHGGAMQLKSKRILSEEDYVEMMESRRWKYDVRKETLSYLRDDVLCLAQIWEKFKHGWDSMQYSPQLLRYDTIGQMCHSLFLEKYLPPRTYAQLDVVEDAYFREAVFGGRTEVFRRLAPTLPIHYVDVNSLYPFVMEARTLPAGAPQWRLASTEGRLLRTLRTAPFLIANPTSLRQHESVGEDGEVVAQLMRGELYGFVTVDVHCPPTLFLPVLAERVEQKTGVFKNMFTLLPKVRKTYYTRELSYAVERGYTITRFYAGAFFRAESVYAPIIRSLKEAKMRGEGKNLAGEVDPNVVPNKSLREAAKIGSNSLYGKTLQNIQKSVQMVSSNDELWKVLHRKDAEATVIPIFSNERGSVLEVTVKQTEGRIQKKSNAPLGAAILAEARMVLYDYFEQVQAVGGELLYCDTDSIVYAGGTTLPNTHASTYGAMKVEIPTEAIVPGGFVALCPKTYAFQMVDGSPYIKCKGVSVGSNLVQEMEDEEEERNGWDDLLGAIQEEEGVQTGLSFQRLVDVVRGDAYCIATSSLQFYKSKARLVSSFQSEKMIRDCFDKRVLLSSLAGGRTLPHSNLTLHFPPLLSVEEQVPPRVSSPEGREEWRKREAEHGFLQNASALHIAEFFSARWHWSAGDYFFRRFFEGWKGSEGGSFLAFLLSLELEMREEGAYPHLMG